MFELTSWDPQSKYWDEPPSCLLLDNRLYIQLSGCFIYLVVWAKIFGIMVFIYSVVRTRSNGPISTELNLYFITLIPQINEQPFDSQGKIVFVRDRIKAL